jgi:PAS domain-containing protein
MPASDERLDLAPVEAVKLFSRPKGEGNWYSHKANVLWLADNSDLDDLHRIATHELSHFFLHASTPYGLFADELSAMQEHKVIRFCTEHTRQCGGKIIYPVFQLAQLHASDKAGFRRAVREPDLVHALLRRFVAPWSRDVFLENVCEGRDMASVGAAREDHANVALERFESFAGTTITDQDLFEGFVDAESLETHGADLLRALGSRVEEFTPPRGDRALKKIPAGSVDDLPASPTIRLQSEDKGAPLGAAHVFEGVAQMLERRGSDSAAMLHWGLWVLTGMAFGRPVASQSDFNRLHDTFLALCDLSLFVPAGLVYGRLRTPGMGWHDIQPAMRFRRALEQVEKIGWIEDLESDISRFQDAVSDRLGWPRPDAFLRIGARLKGPAEHYSRHRHACELRQKRRAVFLQPDWDLPDVRTFLTRHLPIARLPGRRRLAVRGDLQTAVGLIINYFMAQYCWDIMVSHEVDPGAILSDQIAFGEHFNNVRNKDEMLAIIFDAVPQMRPTNFRHIGAVTR